MACRVCSWIIFPDWFLSTGSLRSMSLFSLGITQFLLVWTKVALLLQLSEKLCTVPMNLIRAYHMAQKPYQFSFFFSQTDLYFCVSACFGTVPLIFREVLCLRKLLGSILDIFVVFKEFYTHNLDWIFALSYFLIWESFISWRYWG